MKIVSAALGFLVLASLSACQSTGAAKSPGTEVECICGDPQANVVGCYFPACEDGTGNPDNADCVCGGLVAAEGAKTFTSTGDAAPPSRFLGQPQTLYLAGGKTIRGTLVSDNGLSIELKMSDASARTLAYPELDPRSIFRLMRGRAAESDGQANLEVANYARDNGWFSHAKRHYEIAYKADPSLEGAIKEGMARLRDLASRNELDKAQAAMKEGKTSEAEDHAQVILREFPDEAAATEASAMLKDIHARTAAMTASSPDLSKEIEKALSPIRKTYEKGMKSNHDGLTAKGSRSTNNYDRAINDAKSARKSIGKVVKKDPDNAALGRAADELDQQALDLLVDASINKASHFMTRGSYNEALRAVNAALADDPKNSRLLNMRARIEDASSRGVGGWIVGGRR